MLLILINHRGFNLKTRQDKTVLLTRMGKLCQWPHYLCFKLSLACSAAKCLAKLHTLLTTMTFIYRGTTSDTNAALAIAAL